MSRGLFVGDTDYSHQSLNDMTKDLRNWIRNAKLSRKTILKSYKEIKDFTQWKKTPQDLKIIHEKTIMFLETSVDELKNIFSGIKSEIRHDHIKRLESLAATANKISNRYGEIWHNSYKEKEYGTKEFRMIEALYAESRGTLNDLIDLSNLSGRLKDFVVKTSKKSWYEKPLGIVSLSVIAGIIVTVVSYYLFANL